MKLNFWQILGVVIIVIAVIGIAYRKINKDPAAAPAQRTSPATAPGMP